MCQRTYRGWLPCTPHVWKMYQGRKTCRGTMRLLRERINRFWRPGGIQRPSRSYLLRRLGHEDHVLEPGPDGCVIFRERELLQCRQMSRTHSASAPSWLGTIHHIRVCCPLARPDGTLTLILLIPPTPLSVRQPVDRNLCGRARERPWCSERGLV